MSDLCKPITKLSAEQQVIRANCFQPTGMFLDLNRAGIIQKRYSPETENGEIPRR